MATLTVTTNADSGTGSLRAAISNAASGDTIVFDSTIFPAGQTTEIPLASILSLQKSLTFDAGTPALQNDENLLCRVALSGRTQNGIITSAISDLSHTFRGILFTKGKNTFGGAVYANAANKIVFTQCVFTNNSATSGGAVFPNTSPCKFTQCVFTNNSATSGGAVCNSSTTTTFSQCVFTNNSATSGGDVYAGSGAYNQSTLILSNKNILRGGIYSNGYSTGRYPTIQLSGYNGVGGYTSEGTSKITGSGFLALPSSVSVTLPATITRSEFGAGISDFTSSGDSLSWSSVDSTKSVLLENESGGSWSTVSTSATSPTTVSGGGTYRIWDGITFLTAIPPQTLVVTTNSDSGTGSLRAVLAAARDIDTVTFDNSLAGTTITLASKLEITHAVEIVGLVDADGKPDITISGANTYRILSGNYQMTLSNLVFANARNCAIYNEDANGSTFINCVFQNNSVTDYYGAAVCLSGTSTLDTASFTNCIFTGNISKLNTVYGVAGAMFANFININASNCVFLNNVAEGVVGGAIIIQNTTTLTLNNCEFTGNSVATKSASTGDLVGDAGGAIYATGGIVATDCTFTNNTVNNQYDGDGGGAVFVGYGGTFSDCVFSGNSAKTKGGAVHVSYLGASFSGCSFIGNAATYNSGQAGKDATQGGAVFSNDTYPVTFDDCTFSNNSSAQFGSSLATVNGSFALADCVFSGGSATTFDVFLVRNGSTTSLTLNGGNDLKTGVATYSHSGTPGISNSRYNGVGGYEVKSGNASTFSGSGFIALPPSAIVTLPGTITRSQYGAGISNFSAGEDSLSWSSVDATRTVLLEKQNGGSWDTIDVDASSPATVSQTGTYRIWDGASFLSTSIRFPIVVTNTNDSGAGSLRAAINSATADDTITFDASLEGETIHLLSGLSATNGATIIGLVDSNGNPAITIDGSPDVEILTSNLPVVVSNINFENGNIAFWSGDAGVDGSSFTNCTFSGFVMNALEITITGGGSLASVELTDCTFTENGSGAYAYAVTVFSGVDLTLENCDFHDNDVSALWIIDDVDITLSGGNVIDEGISFKDAGTANLTLEGYNGVGAYTTPDNGTVTATGTGFLALPDDAVLTLPATVTRSEFGAGISDLKNSDLVLTWSSVDDTKTVLLQVADNDDWDTVSTSASSPETVNDEGVYRIWDGRVFLTVSALKTVYWLVKGWATETHGGGSSSLNWTVTNISVDPNLGGLE